MNGSLWWQTGPSAPGRPRLQSDHAADVAIVGAGFTGIWTAYYLNRIDPSLRIAVLEAGQVGFGASGRNGGWCSALFPAELPQVERAYGRDEAIAMQRTMHGCVVEVGDVARRHGIDCSWAHGGSLYVARSPAQLRRAQAQIAEARDYGFGSEDYRLLDATESRARIGATDSLGAVYTPHCAALDPLKLLRGIADQVESAGVEIFEHTRVVDVGTRRLTTSDGHTVTAANIVRATEAYTALLPGQRRTIAPVYSLMIATAPLPSDLWDEIGLAQRETFNDLRHLIIYGQRTADDRLAFGGRGAPYHFGSALRSRFDRDATVHESLYRVLVELFPPLAGVEVTHRWGGPLGIARDWWARVVFDPASGFGWAGGYVGDGVGTSNLAGRTLAALITDTPSDLRDLPWVNRPLQRWEPEPLRWAATNAALTAMRVADATETKSGRPSRLADLVNRLIH